MTAERVALLVGIVLTVAIAALAFRYHAAAGPLWRDEVNSVNVAARTPLAAVVEAAPLDSFPLAWPLVLHGWIGAGLGEDDAGLRRFGLVVSLATLGVAWWAGRRLELDAPLATLLLFGLSPSVIVYGGQVRGYGLGALAMAWCTGATWSFLRRPGRGRFAVLVGATVLAAQTYFANAFLVVALAAGAAAAALPRRRWAALAGVLAADAIAAASVALNLPSFRYALAVAPIEQGDPSLLWLLEVFRHALAPGVPVLSVAWAAAALLAIAGGALAWRKPTAAAGAADDVSEGERGAFALVAAGGALVTCFFYLDVVARLATQYWYYLSLMAVLALCADVGIALLARRVRFGPALRAGLVAATALAALPAVASTVPLRMTNVDLVAETIAREGEPRDLAVVFPWYVGISFARYDRGRVPWITLPDFSDHTVHVHLEVADRMRRGDAGVADELARVERTLRGGGSVWLVGEPMAPPPAQAPPPLVPAPGGPRGWNAGPYLEGWELRLGALLRDHAGVIERVDVPAFERVNAWENVPLYRARGWR